jgi:hypothetical protein
MKWLLALVMLGMGVEVFADQSVNAGFNNSESELVRINKSSNDLIITSDKLKAVSLSKAAHSPHKEILLDNGMFVIADFFNAKLDVFSKTGDFIQALKLPGVEEGTRLNCHAFSDGKEVLIIDGATEHNAFLWNGIDSKIESIPCSCGDGVLPVLFGNELEDISSVKPYKEIYQFKGKKYFFKGKDYDKNHGPELVVMATDGNQDISYRFKTEGIGKCDYEPLAVNDMFCCIDVYEYDNSLPPSNLGSGGVGEMGFRQELKIVDRNGLEIFRKKLERTNCCSAIVNGKLEVIEHVGSGDIVYKAIFPGFND